MKPLCDEIEKYKKKRALRLHTPTHGGKNAGSLRCGKYDLTELNGLDNLLCPEGAIAQSQDLMAQAYKCKACHFITTGATQAVFCMLYAVKDRGNSIIIQRNSHSSVYNAVRVFNIEPIIIDENFTAVELENTLLQNPNCIGVLITSPNYYGVDCEMWISDIVKKHNKLLLVDNAHGSNAIFMRGENGLAGVCDIYAVSFHKGLPTLTGGAGLNVNNSKLIEKAGEAVKVLHSTSPSYLTLYSIDFSREYMLENTKKINLLAMEIDTLKHTLIDLGAQVMQNNDKLRLVVDFTKRGFGGYEFGKMLERYRVYAEFCDPKRVVFLFSPMHNRKDVKRLLKVIIKILKKEKPQLPIINYPDCVKPAVVMPYLVAVNSKTEIVPINEAVGKIVGVNAGLYPPCVPLVVAGEVLSEETAQILKSFKTNVFGVVKGSISVIK